MNRVEIEQNTFKKMLEGVKHAVATDDCRPLLQFIKVVVTKTTVTLYALDGFRAAKIQIAKESESEFTCFIKPLTFKPIKRGDAMAILEYDADNRTGSVLLNLTGNISTLKNCTQTHTFTTENSESTLRMWRKPSIRYAKQRPTETTVLFLKVKIVIRLRLFCGQKTRIL